MTRASAGVRHAMLMRKKAKQQADDTKDKKDIAERRIKNKLASKQRRANRKAKK